MEFLKRDNEREILRSMLPGEIRAVIDDTETRVNQKIDQSIEAFQQQIKQKFDAFSELDFSREMEGLINANLADLSQLLVNDMATLKSSLQALQLEIQKLDQDKQLNEVTQKMDKINGELNNALVLAHSKIKGMGQTLTKTTVSALKKGVTGIL
jgi:hypothetical protein